MRTHTSIKEIAHESGISTGNVERILTIDLQMRKLCARWIPHKLTDSQRLARLKMSQELLKEYSNAFPRRLYEFFTRDETWTSYNEPERKSATCTWVGINDDELRTPPSKKARPDRLDGRYCTQFSLMHMDQWLKYAYLRPKSNRGVLCH